MSKYEDAAYAQELEAKVEKLEAENKRLREEVNRLKGIPAAREGLTFDDRSGVWFDDSGRAYCPTCLGNDKRNPMKAEDGDWRCTTGDHFFYGPDSAPGSTFVKSDYDPYR